jgi:hypothetical protein
MNWMSEMLDLLGFGRKTLVERWTDRLLGAIEQAAGSFEGATGRATEVADTARRRGSPILREARDRARTGALAGRDAVSERVDAIAKRAAELREQRERRREERREARRARQVRRQVPRRAPMQIHLRRDDRITLRGRRPIDLRMSDGGVIRYRYYERPSFGQRVLFHLTGRRVWPPR